jgi:alpha-D-ribose 1-methylphosphonate 5-triphosphate synthase subunit PhnH
MTAVNLSEVGAGFQDIALGSQSIFRAALEALSYPGRQVAVNASFDTPTAANRSSSGLLLALLEPGSRLWLSPSLIGTDAAAWIVFHTNCEITQRSSDAEFAWIKHWQELPKFSSLCLGTDEYPDHSTTCVIDVMPSHDNVPPSLFTLTGPGIKTATTIELQFTTLNERNAFIQERTLNHSLFPRGVDLFLATTHGLIGLPRTTSIELSDEASKCM